MYQRINDIVDQPEVWSRDAEATVEPQKYLSSSHHLSSGILITQHTHFFPAQKFFTPDATTPIIHPGLITQSIEYFHGDIYVLDFKRPDSIFISIGRLIHLSINQSTIQPEGDLIQILKIRRLPFPNFFRSNILTY
ncbi:hypothetical protein DID88_001069 [Monilinia fructigena]|uniref:Uncharacterized protein n=1 Tax=Monilinia fructigena TaxID=38457 RepID=A0A395J1D2_9HELO|nr:hypothetical protein DID88_001069 [Monilinia fructigena]